MGRVESWFDCIVAFLAGHGEKALLTLTILRSVRIHDLNGRASTRVCNLGCFVSLKLAILMPRAGTRTRPCSGCKSCQRRETERQRDRETERQRERVLTSAKPERTTRRAIDVELQNASCPREETLCCGAGWVEKRTGRRALRKKSGTDCIKPAIQALCS
jgi:hypothetical protein